MSLNAGYTWPDRLGNRLTIATARAITHWHKRSTRRHTRLARWHKQWLAEAQQHEQELLKEYQAWESAR